MLLRTYSLFLALFFAGCATNTTLKIPAPVPVVPSSQPIDISISAFSTFMSEAGKRACQSLNKREPCIEDAITPEQFFSRLQAHPYFTEVMASATGTDYQLLIANHASAMPPPSSSPSLPIWVVTEFSLLWRGLEIHSTRIAQQVSVDKTATDIADSLFQEWWQRVSTEGIFTLEYLYRAVGASDYMTQLRLPMSVGEFALTQTELSPDPFNGVLSRYRHPQFDDAFLDVSVFPIQEDMSMKKENILRLVLEEEAQSAEQVAQVQGLSLVAEQPIKGLLISGELVMVQSLRADNEFEEPLFATSFAFIQQDKVVKISTNFPLNTSTPLVKGMVPAIKVPKESRLMKAIRQIVSQGASADSNAS